MRIVLDSSTSNRYFDDNGFLVIRNNKIAKAGVFEYLGREINSTLPENEVFKVFRSPEELEKSAKDFEGMPIKFGHEWVDPTREDLKVGAVSGEVRLEPPYLVADIKIFDKDTIDKIVKDGIVELSPGYLANYLESEGEYQGEKYQFKQVNMKYNHLAIVNNGRSGSQVKIADEMPKIDINIGDMNMSKKRKVQDECSLEEQKTADNDKKDVIREIVAVAIKPDNEFEGGEDEKLETISKIATSLNLNDTADDDEVEEVLDNEEEKKAEDNSEVAEIKELLNALASKVEALEKAKAEARDNDEVEEEAIKTADSKKVMDAKIEKALASERKRTTDAFNAYNEVSSHVGNFNYSGMSADEIYKYAYENLTGEKVKVQDGKASFKAYVKSTNKQAVMDSMPTSNAVRDNLSNFVMK